MNNSINTIKTLDVWHSETMQALSVLSTNFKTTLLDVRHYLHSEKTLHQEEQTSQPSALALSPTDTPTHSDVTLLKSYAQAVRPPPSQSQPLLATPCQCTSTITHSPHSHTHQRHAHAETSPQPFKRTSHTFKPTISTSDSTETVSKRTVPVKLASCLIQSSDSSLKMTQLKHT